jgi:hypothetical protein
MPDLMPVPAPSLAAIAERDRRAAEEIRAHANLYRIPLADLLASLALDGWQWRRSQADGNV